MHTMRSLGRLAALATLVLLVSCAQPVPPARAAYVGDWRGENMQLLISAGGQVHYFRQRGGSRTTVDMPIQAFEGDDIIVQDALRCVEAAAPRRQRVQDDGGRRGARSRARAGRRPGLRFQATS
jgi:hypothetical protein